MTAPDSETDAADPPAEAVPSPTDTESTLESVRTDPTRRRTLAVAGAVVGLSVAQFHWLGFLLGGALVGLAAPSLRRALAYGLTFGLVGVALFAATLLQVGSLASYVATGQVFYVGVAIPVGLGLVGSLVRGVV